MRQKNVISKASRRGGGTRLPEEGLLLEGVRASSSVREGKKGLGVRNDGTNTKMEYPTSYVTTPLN